MMKFMPVALAIGLAQAVAGCAHSSTLESSVHGNADAQVYAEAGVAAARGSFPGLVPLCDLTSRLRNIEQVTPEMRERRAAERARARAEGVRDSTVAAPPAMKVFDNLHFLGTNAVSAWLLGTEADGYILIDALNTAEEAETVILGGMRRLGLSPERIMYLVITHAHGDHFGGHPALAHLDLKTVMSERDWSLAQSLAPHPRFGVPPARDVSVGDGDVLTVGDQSLEVRLTPGHTPGTISLIFPVLDGGVRHSAALWGGTGFNFGEDVERFEEYALSAERFMATARERGVDVFLSNHPARDGALSGMRLLADRKDGDPHPFVRGDEAMVPFQVFSHCARAQALRFGGET